MILAGPMAGSTAFSNSLLSQHNSIFLSTATAALPSTAALILPSLAQRVTRLQAAADQALPDNEKSQSPKMFAAHLEKLTPRVRSICYMAIAMAIHFGGYEFYRNSCLALFTSSETGFSSPAAFPFANALVSPFSLLLLWGYGQQLDAHGPRAALRNTTLFSIFFIGIASVALRVCHGAGLHPLVGKALIAVTFLYQNAYQSLLYTQYWSFVGSVTTPDEGSRWFASLGGFSSIVCGVMGGIIPYLLPHTGLHGLMALTCAALTISYLCGDRAYALSQEHNFDPAEQLKAKHQKKKKESSDNNDGDSDKDKGYVGKSIDLFRRVPTLGALFCEVLSWQSLNTILGVAFVTALKANIADDVARSAYFGRFYSYVNGASAILQFLVLPNFMKFAEPKLIWRTMPIIPLVVCFMQMLQTEKSLMLLSTAMFLAKVTDYSIRTVVYVMVYQPLDFESRYVGKEIIGVFGSRFGKSGMSLLVSALTAIGWTTLPGLCRLSFGAVALWQCSTVWLSQYIPSQQEAQAAAMEQRKESKKTQ
mmetsp:Transcript_4871/g.10348  ORF Transcript_4871/g.10348 Transcript_4871/m.10348 type:complete len:534 (-) Transcript_4871:299-1900(-)